MKKIILVPILVILIQTVFGQQWEAKLIAVHPTGVKDTIWFGIDSNATDGYDVGVDSLDTYFKAPIGIRIMDDSLYQAGYQPHNLRKSYKPFSPTGYGDTIQFVFFVGSDSVPYALDPLNPTNSVYLTSDTNDFLSPVYFGDYRLHLVGVEGLSTYTCVPDNEGFGLYEFDSYYFGCDSAYIEPVLSAGDPAEYQGTSAAEDFCGVNMWDCRYYKLEITMIFLDTNWIKSASVKQALENEIKLYPNPCVDELRLVKEVDSGTKVSFNGIVPKITNLIGTELPIEWGYSNNAITINTSTLPRGVYMLFLMNEENHTLLTKKIIKQ